MQSSRHARLTGAAWLLLSCVVATTAVVAGCVENPESIQERAPASSQAGLVDHLATAYNDRDLTLFTSLLAHTSDPNRSFHFVFLDDPKDLTPSSWGFDEETRLHRRMFLPRDVSGTEPPVPTPLWLDGIEVQWVQVRDFAEREDYYTENGGLDGKLDPSLWRVVDGLFHSYANFELPQGVTYVIDGLARFVILEDRRRNVGDPEKFVFLEWEELAPEATSQIDAVTRARWSQFKRLYRSEKAWF